MKTAVILGAGFSKNSGIPVQAELPGLLIDNKEKNDFEEQVTRVLREFYQDIFGYSGGGLYPNLDDMFTCIDISTNSGHHLGIQYPSLALRTVRRFLEYRVFSILESDFRYSEDVSSLLESLARQYEDTSFIVLNWDTVLEKYLLNIFPDAVIDYCNGGNFWDENQNGDMGRVFHILKMHGSCNWLYCDNCRTLYNDMNNSLTVLNKAGFLQSDFYGFDESTKGRLDDCLLRAKCKCCQDTVSSHIATFSYRKSFRVNSFANIWREAENKLTEAEQWIFIGYSLPDADYEFKHLLKISQLKLKHTRKKELAVQIVLLNSDNTLKKYHSFFGNAVKGVFNGGIKEYNNYLKSIH